MSHPLGQRLTPALQRGKLIRKSSDLGRSGAANKWAKGTWVLVVRDARSYRTTLDSKPTVSYDVGK
ncbi:hypothetical protein CPT_Pagan_002 [Xanthomonas phage Pagan]|uniref:Uncharacterized protein n=1 Tax=Xanthomonas phage Pagan TaxID=2591104 RepID=A0A5B9N9V4_9CAUD|nr:hypothetical protein CPT_Pagan_002 [Xanthomonas phage Pagan]